MRNCPLSLYQSRDVAADLALLSGAKSFEHMESVARKIGQISECYSQRDSGGVLISIVLRKTARVPPNSAPGQLSRVKGP